MKRIVLTLLAVGLAWAGFYALTSSAARKPKPAASASRVLEAANGHAPEPADAGRSSSIAWVEPSEPSQAGPHALHADHTPRFIVVGGGATPEFTEVSLEQDAALASRVLAGPGLVLFAGGQGSMSVRTLAEPKPLTLLAQLGAVFDPRGGRASRYRETRLEAQAASLENFETSLALASSASPTPLLVYIATHGLQGSEPRDNFVELWAGESLSVAQLDELTAQAKRPLRFVIASCYSGGFAELAFDHADAGRGATTQDRCGLFAGTWDRQTSGCDPNPDRRAQEGYSIHMLHALQGQDRSGASLSIEQLDFDGDAEISLLEAHTRARIASHSIDVPTTTSERFLREVIKAPAAPNWQLLPEEHAVVEQLGARLGLPNLAAVERRYAQLSAKLDALQPELDAAEDELERTRAQLGAQLLARWPVLADAYHDEFSASLQRESASIAQVLTEGRLALRFREASAEAEAISGRADAIDADEAVVMRLLRAYETAGLASALAARGGEPYAHYRALLACERGRLAVQFGSTRAR